MHVSAYGTQLCLIYKKKRSQAVASASQNSKNTFVVLLQACKKGTNVRAKLAVAGTRNRGETGNDTRWQAPTAATTIRIDRHSNTIEPMLALCCPYLLLRAIAKTTNCLLYTSDAADE